MQSKIPGIGQSSPVEVADRALTERPRFTIRMQVYISVLLLLFTALVIAATTISTTTMVQQEVQLFELASRLVFEIEQSRRFEKNFFLHGTNLDDALDNVQHAHKLLSQNEEQFASIHNGALLPRLTRHLTRYHTLLEAHGQEAEVRRHGRQLVSLAATMEVATRRTLDSTLSMTRKVQYALLGFLLLYIFGMTYVLVRRIVAPIRRLMEHTHRIAAGDYTPIMPARRYRDEFSALAVSINDMLAELERRQDILVASHKMRAVGTLTASVAHELNNPINNITLTAHVMLEDYAELDDDERADMLRDIVGEADRTKKIVAGLLDFARQSESQIKPIDLGRVVVETVALAQNQLNLKGARATAEIAEMLPTIHGDAQQLSQVLLNLLLNAVDVTDKGGTVEILVRSSGDNYVEVQVRDHGPGIPQHILPYIFDPFFTTKPKGKGTGLGLAICKGIVNKHGGDITVQSRVGDGSTFTVSFPVTAIPVDFGAVAEQVRPAV